MGEPQPVDERPLDVSPGFREGMLSISPSVGLLENEPEVPVTTSTKTGDSEKGSRFVEDIHSNPERSGVYPPVRDDGEAESRGSNEAKAKAGQQVTDKQKIQILRREYKRIQSEKQDQSEALNNLSLKLSERGQVLHSEHKRNVRLQKELETLRDENSRLRLMALEAEAAMKQKEQLIGGRMTEQKNVEQRNVAPSVTEDWDADCSTDFGGGGAYLNDTSVAEKEGLLVRKKTTRGKQNVWVVLKGSVLVFQKGPQARKAMAYIPLVDLVFALPSAFDPREKKWPFRLVSRRAMYTVFARTESERDGWVSAINEKLVELKGHRVCLWPDGRDDPDRDALRRGCSLGESFFTPDL